LTASARLFAVTSVERAATTSCTDTAVAPQSVHRDQAVATLSARSAAEERASTTCTVRASPWQPAHSTDAVATASVFTSSRGTQTRREASSSSVGVARAGCAEVTRSSWPARRPHQEVAAEDAVVSTTVSTATTAT